MTKQEYYDLLVKSAGDGTFPSIHNGVCKYRADKTATCKRRCAVGLLIPNEKYTPEMDGTWSLHPICMSGAVEIPEGLDENDLANIQATHDSHAIRVWNRDAFIRDLNDLRCFQDVKKVEVSS